MNPLRKHLKSSVLMLSAFAASTSYGAGTAAGTAIHNAVEVRYQIGGTSNATHVERAQHTFKVSELIRGNVSALEPQGVGTATPDQNAVLSFEVSNIGNGQENFLLSTAVGATGDFPPQVTSLWLESNGQPGWQSDDLAYSSLANGLPLDADQSKTVYVLSTIPSALSDAAVGELELTATAASQGANQLKAGESLDTAGDGGIEAVIAQDFAKSQDQSHYTVSTVKLDVQKQIVNVSDPYGGNLKMPGSKVTYRIRVVASGGGTAENLKISDPVPASMSYQPNSLALDGQSQTDGADGDAAYYDRQQQVAWFTPGTIQAPKTHELELTYIID